MKIGDKIKYKDGTEAVVESIGITRPSGSFSDKFVTVRSLSTGQQHTHYIPEVQHMVVQA